MIFLLVKFWEEITFFSYYHYKIKLQLITHKNTPLILSPKQPRTILQTKGDLETALYELLDRDHAILIEIELPEHSVELLARLSLLRLPMLTAHQFVHRGDDFPELASRYAPVAVYVVQLERPA